MDHSALSSRCPYCNGPIKPGDRKCNVPHQMETRITRTIDITQLNELLLACRSPDEAPPTNRPSSIPRNPISRPVNVNAPVEVQHDLRHEDHPFDRTLDQVDHTPPELRLRGSPRPSSIVIWVSEHWKNRKSLKPKK